jgi:hypothetical protein
VGLASNALFGWSWADPVAGLVAGAAVREGRNAWKGDLCCDHCEAPSRSRPHELLDPAEGLARVGVQVRGHAQRAGGGDVGGSVVDEQRVGRAGTDAVQGDRKDARVGLRTADLTGQDDAVGEVQQARSGQARGCRARRC